MRVTVNVDSHLGSADRFADALDVFDIVDGE